MMAGSTTSPQLAANTDYGYYSFFSVVILAAAILIAGVIILWMIIRIPKKPDNPDTEQSAGIRPEVDYFLWRNALGEHALQILGISFLLPVVLVISVATNLPSDAVTALLGSIIGYVFGSSKSADRVAGADRGMRHDGLRRPAANLGFGDRSSGGGIEANQAD